MFVGKPMVRPGPTAFTCRASLRRFDLVRRLVRALCQLPASPPETRRRSHPLLGFVRGSSRNLLRPLFSSRARTPRRLLPRSRRPVLLPNRLHALGTRPDPLPGRFPFVGTSSASAPRSIPLFRNARGSVSGIVPLCRNAPPPRFRERSPFSERGAPPHPSPLPRCGTLRDPLPGTFPFPETRPAAGGGAFRTSGTSVSPFPRGLRHPARRVEPPIPGVQNRVLDKR